MSNYEKLVDGSYIARYSDGRRELFQVVTRRIIKEGKVKLQRVIKGSGPVKHLEEAFNSEFLKDVMRNRPPLNNKYSEKIKLMYDVGYFVVPNVMDSNTPENLSKLERQCMFRCNEEEIQDTKKFIQKQMENINIELD